MMSHAAARSHWAQIGEVGFIAGMRFLFWVCRHFGRWPFRVMLYPVLAWYVMTNARARTASAAYLRRIREYGKRAQVNAGLRDVLRHFASFAECILDKMLLWGGLTDIDNTMLFGQRSLTRTWPQSAAA